MSGTLCSTTSYIAINCFLNRRLLTKMCLCLCVLLQELAHLYHYYLHGEAGNRDGNTASGGLLPNGEPLPNITLEYLTEGRSMWKRRLVEVDDDLETRMLRAQKSELQFTLEVPNKVSCSIYVCGIYKTVQNVV